MQRRNQLCMNLKWRATRLQSNRQTLNILRVLLAPKDASEGIFNVFIASPCLLPDG